VLNGGTPEGFLVGQRYFVRRLQFGLTGEAPSAAAQGDELVPDWKKG